MAEFSFLRDQISSKWVISAPRRAHRTNVEKTSVAICPFCIGGEGEEEELYRVGGEGTNWQVRVVPNKFPFTQHHEIIIHSPDHHKNFDEFPFSQTKLLLETYRERFIYNRQYGQVYIFHNRGGASGESLPHPHTQLVVIPSDMMREIRPLDLSLYKQKKPSPFILLKRTKNEVVKKEVETEQFFIFCPKTSEWPDEVWIAPKKADKLFGESTDDEIFDLSFVLSRLIQIYDIRHGNEFPFNFYIYPGKNWYLRLIPRLKIIGGFELGTNILVNTQDPKETVAFIKEHFWQPDTERIKQKQQADYWKKV